MNELKVNREYKDRLFKLTFRERADLLQLYNAINGTEYDNPEDLIINTLEDAIYMGMKNDVSFVVDDVLNLYEQQSTFNPNMPLRGLFYITNIFKSMIGVNADIYSSKILQLPLPKYIVFYNGTAEQPEKTELSIRDAFIGEKKEESCLEFVATMLNINLGYNKELMEKCRRLKEYAQLIHRIRVHIAENDSVEDAIRMSVDECIREGILADILSKNKAEVYEMILTEYNEQNHIANEKQISKEEGLKEGIKEGRKLGLSEGKYRNLLEQICKKIVRNKSLEQICDELEETPEEIRPLYEEALQAAPEYDIDQIYERLEKNR